MARYRFADWPLRAKMAVLIVVASLLPLGIATWTSISTARQQLQREANTQLETQADRLVLQMDQFIRGHLSSVNRLARMSAAIDLLRASPSAVEDFRKRVTPLLALWPASDPTIRGIAMLDASGVVVVATEDGLLGKSMLQHKFVKQALGGAVVISDVFLAEPEVGEVPTVALLAPMLGVDRQVQGVTAYFVRAGVLSEMLKRASGADSGRFSVLFDRLGIRVAHSNRENLVYRPRSSLEPAVAEELIAEQRFGSNTRALLADVREFSTVGEVDLAAPPADVFQIFAPGNMQWNYVVARRLSEVPWMVFSLTPMQALDSAVARIVWQKLLFAAAIMLAALVVGLLFAEAILRPIRSLSGAAQAIAAGNLGVRTPVTRKDELGDLGSKFNTMALRLQEQAAALVKESEAQFRRLFVALNEGFCIAEVLFDASGKAEDVRFLEVNPAFEVHTGLHHARGRRMNELVPVHGHPWFEVLGEVALTGEPVQFDGEAKQLGRYLDVAAYRIGGAESRSIAVLVQDVTAQRAAQQHLQAQLERLSLLHRITRAIGERQDLASIFQVVIREIEDRLPIDFGCICLYEPNANQLVTSRFGAKGEQWLAELELAEQTRISALEYDLARCVRGDLVYEPDVGVADSPFLNRLAKAGLRAFVAAPLLVESRVFGVLMATRRKAGSFTSGECEFLRQLSEHVALAAHQAQLYASLQSAYDDLRQTQQSAMQQERLRSLGQMASGIAHDINNAISPVALYTDSLLEQEPHISAQGRNQLQTIQRAVHDVAATVARMREFYRPREPQLLLAPVQLNELVPQVVELTRARWSAIPQQSGVTIELHMDLHAGLPAIMGAASEIREALTNLVLNAVDAMPRGGVLTMRTTVLDADYVQVEVSDTGVGMDDVARQRCMEPFFTTKGERGTGLGLAMVFGMAQRHSASIDIDSVPGRGTTVKLQFDAAVSAVVADESAIGVVPRDLRVLVVDDDPVLLRSLRDTLEVDGHEVVAANGGHDGIDQFQLAMDRGQPFDIVITDLGMPYLDGRQVAAALKGLSPDVPIIMLTGWGQRLEAEGDIPAHVDMVLSKPPKMRDLREALARCVRRERG